MIKSTADLRPAVYNPRKISDKQASMLKKSMEEFGDLSGIVVNVRTGNMIGGHQRINNLSEDCKIVKKSFSDNIGTVATGYIQTDNGRWHYREVDWDEIKEKAANIAANKHGGEWDLPKLDVLLEDLKSIDFDMELVGFDNVKLKTIGVVVEDNYASQYGVIVICKDEGHQEEVYNMLNDKGYDCKVVTT